MTDFKKDMTKIQSLVSEAFTATGALVALADGGAMKKERLQRALETTMERFEQAALLLRDLCEKHSPGAGGYGKRPGLPARELAGHVEQIGYGWLRIRLNTLLPHCRYQSPAWLTDTIRRLLDDYEAGGTPLPFYPKAMLVIEESSDIHGRHVFDADNKGWKAVCNAIKGRLVPDDDQYTLHIALLSEQSAENICRITLLDQADAADFFGMRVGDGLFDPIR